MDAGTLPKAWQIDDTCVEKAVSLRHRLHRQPELSGRETATAQLIADRMSSIATKVITGLGGTGVAAIFGSGPDTLLIRCELDALPILEQGTLPHRSTVEGVAHLCGHDGHMAILDTVAHALARHPPDCRVILLFQPAEETGAGARAVLDDPRFADLCATMAVALHNLPGLPLGAVALQEGPATCASRGLIIRLHGKTSHAAEPGKGKSPADVMSRLIPALGALTNDCATAALEFRLATVTHARLGEAAVGITPGEAEIWVTLRALLNDRLDALEGNARALVMELAAEFAPEFAVHEAFSHTVNHPDATALLNTASAHLPRAEQILPQRFSEDFGLFGSTIPSAMLFLGAGEHHPALHNPDYDFPDSLIKTGAEIFLRAIHQFGSR